MADDEDKEDDKVEKISDKSGAEEVQNSILKEQKKKKQADFKKAMLDVQAAAEVFFLAYDKAAAIQDELRDMKKIDFSALRNALKL